LRRTRAQRRPQARAAADREEAAVAVVAAAAAHMSLLTRAPTARVSPRTLAQRHRVAKNKNLSFANIVTYTKKKFIF